MALSLRIDTYEHPYVTKNWPTILRSLKNTQKTGMRKALLKTMIDVELRSPAGLYLGKSAIYNVKMDRLDSVATRIVKGLFYFENGFVLPNGYRAEASCMDKYKIDNEILKFIHSITSAKEHIIGNRVFSYWLRSIEEDKNISIWFLIFYEKVGFIGFTLKD